LHRELHREFDGDFYGGRPVVAEEDALEPGGRDCAKLVGETSRFGMRNPGQ
jgi:hypothetical protein